MSQISIFKDLVVNMDFHFSFWTVSTFGLASLIVYFIKKPEKLEKLIGMLSRLFMCINQKLERTYVKYDTQSTINSYVAKVSKNVHNIGVDGVRIMWTDPKEISKEDFIRNGQMVIHLKKSENQNKNIVNASMAFISGAFLKKTKSYIAKYQSQSLDIYATYDLLRNEHREIIDQFVQDFMKEKMDNKKIADLFEKYEAINKAGLFYPILVQELTFLGEKVFSHRRDQSSIVEEVKDLIFFLKNYAERKVGEEMKLEFNGNFCKFAIRIVGKKSKVDNSNISIYTKSVESVKDMAETVYLIGYQVNKGFIKRVVCDITNNFEYDFSFDKSYNAIIKDTESNDLKVKSYLAVLRKKTIEVYHY